ncbi:MAG: hypothetical protein WBG76_17135 [Ornithinimicrobium sp.]
MTETSAHSRVDDATRVRLASLSLVTRLRSTNTIAVRIRSQWLGLAPAYRAPEADLLLHRMDRPATRAVELVDAANLAHDALQAYADRLGELAGWQATTTTEAARLDEARSAAELVCAAALQAIPRPAQGMAGPTDHHLTTGMVAAPGHTSAHPLGQPWSPAIPMQCVPPPTGWSHPERATTGLLPRLIDLWGAVAPPDTDDPMSHALYTFGMLGFAGEARASWMVTVEHGSFRPRGALGRYLPVSSLSTVQRFAAGAGSVSTKKGLSNAQRLATFTPGGTFEAKGHRGAVRTHWTATASRWGRANAAVTVASSGLAAWQDNSGYATNQRIGRTATQGAAVAGGAVAGGQAGALVGSAIGTAIMPGAGTVVGATVGGLVGGFAGSELGGWVGDQLVAVGGEAGDLIGDSLLWAGDQTQDIGGDLLDMATFWD